MKNYCWKEIIHLFECQQISHKSSGKKIKEKTFNKLMNKHKKYFNTYLKA